jgi:hypothetical protein
LVLSGKYSKAVRKVKIDFSLKVGGGLICVYGSLDPEPANVPITIEIKDEKGNSWLLYSVTNANGNFMYDPTNQNLSFDKGTYSVQVMRPKVNQR